MEENYNYNLKPSLKGITKDEDLEILSILIKLKESNLNSDLSDEIRIKREVAPLDKYEELHLMDRLVYLWEKYVSGEPGSIYMKYDDYRTNYFEYRDSFIKDPYYEMSEVEFIESQIESFESILEDGHKVKAFGHDITFFVEHYYISSAKMKISFLRNRLNLAKKEIEKEFSESIEIKEEIEEIDYSDNNKIERIAIMHELGILDYLKTIQPFNTGANKLSEVLSSFTGMNQKTIQSYINPIGNSKVDQSKSALTENNIKNSHRKLSDMGMNIKDFKTQKQ